MPRIYTDKFKRSVLDLINDGMTQKQVFADLGASKSVIRAWVREARLRVNGLESSPDPEEARARASALTRIRELEREAKILREAAAYISQANLKLGGTHPKCCTRWSVTLLLPGCRWR